MMNAVSIFTALWCWTMTNADGYEVIGNGRYLMSTAKMTWDEGRAFCSTQFGTTLATITNDADAQIFQDLTFMFIGLGKVAGGWAWESGHSCGDTDSTCKDLKYWIDGQPSGTGPCVKTAYKSASIDDLLMDTDCGSKVRVLCDAPPTFHWIAAGNPKHETWYGVPNVECAADSRTQASEPTSFAPGDTDIGVSCCTQDGSGGVRRFGDDEECLQAKSYFEAEAICEGNGYRLCTLDEMLRLRATKNTGCWHDSRYNWVSTECGQATAHQVIQGKPSWGGWEDSNPDNYCQSDDNNQAAYISKGFDLDIGVGCCSMDGTSGDRPSCDVHPATYQEAVDLCSANNKRLCTLQEMQTEITEGTGCNYDGAYLWTLTSCDSPSASNAPASHTVHHQDGGESVDDFVAIALGAAVGVAMVGVVVAVIVVMRRRKGMKKEEEVAMSEVVTAPKVQPVESMDGVEAVSEEVTTPKEQPAESIDSVESV